MADTLYDELGGRPCLEKVHKIFYDKLLADPWLKEFFKKNEQWHLEVQQTEFMMRLFGGPVIYCGRMPKYAHAHMFITEEAYIARHKLLEESLVQAGIHMDLRKRWLDYDIGLKRALVKSSKDECTPRYHNEPIWTAEKPVSYSMCPHKKRA